MDIAHAVAALEGFVGADLTQTLARVEASLQGVTIDNCATTIAGCGARSEVLTAAGVIKRLAGQINVVIHALGILLCIPQLLAPGEAVEYVSLGAGNTGRAFDLETSERIAEFKFIRWQGGAETIRQNGLFKDFYLLAENPSRKRKFLYVVGTKHPLRFFKSGRALSSVLSQHPALQESLSRAYPGRFRKVREYYAFRKGEVVIQDISNWVIGLTWEVEADDPNAKW